MRALVLLALALLLFGCVQQGTPQRVPEGEKPIIVLFTASSHSVEEGQSVEISWKVEKASKVFLNGEEVPLKGQKSFSPSKTTSFTLLAVGKGGTATASIVIHVISPKPSQAEGGGKQAQTNNQTNKEEANESAGGNETGEMEECDGVIEEGTCIPLDAAEEFPSNDIAAKLKDFGIHIQLPKNICGDGICTGNDDCCQDCCEGLCINGTCTNITTIPYFKFPKINFHFYIPTVKPLPYPFFPINTNGTNTSGGSGGSGGSGEADNFTYSEEDNPMMAFGVREESNGIRMRIYYKTPTIRGTITAGGKYAWVYFDTDDDGEAEYKIGVSPSQAYFYDYAQGKYTHTFPVFCTQNYCEFTLTPKNLVKSAKVWLAQLDYKYRLPSVAALSFSSSPLKLERAHAGDPYIVLLAEKITVYDDEDPTGEGEIMFVSVAKSGDIERRVAFPMKIWYELNSGDTILAGKENAFPMFAAKESSMKKPLSFVFTAIDNDEYPGWLEDTFDVLTSKEFIEWASAIAEVGGAGDITKNKLFSASLKVAKKVKDWIGKNEEIGSITNAFSKDENWGIKSGNSQVYDAMNKNLKLTYGVYRVYPPKLKARVRLYGVKIVDSGDSNWECCSWYTTTGGEFYMWNRVSAGFAGKDLGTKITRCPEKDTVCVCNGWVKCPTYKKELFGQRPKYLTLYEGSAGPFLYVELAGWDEDNPSVGDDDDPLGIVAKTWLLDEKMFEWELEKNKPKPKVINRKETVAGVSGGKYTYDLEVVLEPA